MSNNTLMGGIAPDLQSMSNLEILHLDHNQFKHTIPDIFNHLNRIEELQLDHNQFTGTIPSTLFDLKDLSECGDVVFIAVTSKNLFPESNHCL